MDNFEEDFFSNAHLVHVEVDLLDDLWDEIQSECRANEWPEDEGLRYLLAAGLAAVQAERLRQYPDEASAIEHLQRQRMQTEGRYAVMKYRAYQFMQAAKILEMKLNACRTELEALRRINAQLRAQLDAKV